MVVSAARNKCKSLSVRAPFQCFCIADCLLLMVLRIFGYYLFETKALQYHMHQRTTTAYRGIQLNLSSLMSALRSISPAWASQVLWGGCCYKIHHIVRDLDVSPATTGDLQYEAMSTIK